MRAYLIFSGPACLAVWCLFAMLTPTRSFSAEAPETASPPQEITPAVPVPLPALRNKLPIPFLKDVPGSLTELRWMEKHVKDLVTRVSPAVVAVQIDASVGSGVVISESGFVLCAAHVCKEPGRNVRFIFPNGKKARGKTLGTNHGVDAGLMKITDPGRWPYARIGDIGQTRLGDWVLALGHPGGFDAQRSMVVRLGRVISLTAGTLRTDCTLLGGDSGGPLFDMHGQVIGIHSRISEATDENFHVPVGAFLTSWDRLVKGEDWGARSPFRSYVGARGMDHPEGCLLESIEENSPAFKAGLNVGDVVMKVGGKEITGYESFRQFIRQSKPGEALSFDIRRGDNEMSVKVTVEARRRGGPFGR